jgi:16S rRNA (uracil1498-N3)-methyltransferase
VGTHRIHLEGIRAAGEGAVVSVTGDEAAHAVRVKRLAVGERVELFDGRGTVARGVVERVAGRRAAGLEVRVEGVRFEPPLRPRVEVWSATPKGERARDMIDGLSQVGAAAWSPLRTARGVAEAGAAKLDRLRRAALESAKQCGRAWVLEIGEERRPADAVEEGVSLVVADVAGETYRRVSAERVRLLVGPEGGWEAEELASLRTAGATVARFGPHVMRIEVAAVVAAAAAMLESGPDGSSSA